MDNENILILFTDCENAPDSQTRNIGSLSEYPNFNRAEGTPLDQSLTGTIKGYQVGDEYYVLSDEVIILNDYNQIWQRILICSQYRQAGDYQSWLVAAFFKCNTIQSNAIKYIVHYYFNRKIVILLCYRWRGFIRWWA